MSSTRVALLLSGMERYTTVLVYGVSNIVLSRLLTPHDTGLFTVGFGLTVMIGTLRDFGVATYVIQEPDLTDLKWRSALGVSSITCAIVFVAVILASFVAGRIYRDPAITTVMLVSGLTLLLIPFNALVLTWLRREMRYGELYRISFFAAVMQSLVTIALAWDGYGALSMAWGSVANSAALLVGSIRLRPRQFGYRPSLAAWRPIAGLGVYSTIGAICSELTPNGADLMIGRFAGLVALGQFSKGGSLVTFVNQGLTNAVLPVALSLFARKRRHGEPLDAAIPLGLSLLTGVTWPAFAGLAVVAGPAIHVLFGSQWDAAIPPARLVAIAAMVTSMTALHATIFQAAGAMRTRMLVQVAVTPVQLGIMVVAAQGTLQQMALGVIAGALVEYVPSQCAVNHIAGVRAWSILRALLPSAVVAVATSIGAGVGLDLLPAASVGVTVSLGSALSGGTAGWLAGLWVARHPIRNELAPLMSATWRRLVVWQRAE